MKICRLASALFALALMGCTVTVSSPMLGSGGLISVGGGAPAQVPPTTPAQVPATPPVATAPPPASVPAAVNYFPAYAGDAPCPSPEDSVTRVVDATKVAGKPYVLDAQCAIWKFDTDAAGHPIPYTGAGVQLGGAPGGWQWSINGTIAADGATQITIRQHQAWFVTWDGVTRGLERQDNPNAGTTVVQLPPIAYDAPASTAPGTGSAPAAATGPADPKGAAIAPGSSGKSIAANPGGLAAAIASASPGDTINAAPGVYSESVAIGVPLLINGGGTIKNPGTAFAAFVGGADLAGGNVAHYAQGQGGFVPLIDASIVGWSVHDFGLGVSHDGTGGVRNNGDGVFRLQDSYLHDNQMGVGPHAGGNDAWFFKNVLFLNNGLVGDNGYAHNVYATAKHTAVEGGVTSIVQAGHGGGHAFKSRSPKIDFSGLNYFYSSESSSIDIPDGSATPVLIAANSDGGTTIEKKSGDVNHVLITYGVESYANGLAGINGAGCTSCSIRVPADGTQWLIVSDGPVDLTGWKFVNSNDNSPLKAGVITTQGMGRVVGLP